MAAAVLFDLLTALLDSWSLWNAAAGSEAAGRAWRARYLQLTYGCGAYRPYETLVREAARDAGLDEKAAARLESQWDTLEPWDDAGAALAELQGRVRLGVVTNCSATLGRRAAARLNIEWDTVVTAEEAGAYKPDPRPYRLALARLELDPEHALFVAGSGYDLFGTKRVGLRTYWHNRLGLAPPKGAPAPDHEAPALQDLPRWVFEN
jgi:2-haloalkanoic acid dehalogenase type II